MGGVVNKKGGVVNNAPGGGGGGRCEALGAVALRFVGYGMIFVTSATRRLKRRRAVTGHVTSRSNTLLLTH